MNTAMPTAMATGAVTLEKDHPVTEIETVALSTTEDKKLLRRIDLW